MSEKAIKIFSLFGFDVKIDFSWIIIVILIFWTLSSAYFPFHYPELYRMGYWVMGAAGTLGLFISIILHELAHSLVARKYGIPIKGITLFIFGGVAEMDEEPPSAKAEFVMALAGPLSSIIIAVLFYGLFAAARKFSTPVTVTGVFGYIAMINIVLAVFNMLPAFPLDGGRILRSVLWGAKNNLRWATRISSGIGNIFGILMIVAGVMRILYGDFLGGLWLAMIGLFLQNAAKGSYQQLVMRKALEGETVGRFMERSPVTVPPSATLRRLLDDYMYKYYYKMFPVVDNGKLFGCITAAQMKSIPKTEWENKTVGNIADECSPENAVGPNEDIIKAISIMNKTGQSRLMVIENENLVGIIALKDLLHFLSLKIELEGS